MNIDAAVSTDYYVLPSCLASSNSLLGFTGQNLIIETFTTFPTSLGTLQLLNCLFAVNTGLNVTGLDTQSRVVWTQIWDHLTNLHVFQVTSSLLTGSLSGTLPSRITTFVVNDNRLTGVIPADFFSGPISRIDDVSAITLSFHLDNNQFTGDIPADLFTAWKSLYGAFDFDFSDNHLTSIPSSLFHPLENAYLAQLTINLARNSLSGSLPSTIFPLNIIRSYGVISFDASSNLFTGSVPDDMLGSLSQVGSLDWILMGNTRLTGSLPQHFFPASWDYTIGINNLNLDFSRCGFTGVIPSTFLSGRMSYNLTIASLYLNLGNNSLTGTLPNDLLHVTGTPNYILTPNMLLDFSRNALAGPLPNDLFKFARYPTGFSLNLKMHNNPLLDGVFPQAFLQPFHLAGSALNVDFSFTQLSGDLPGACSTLHTEYQLSNSLFDGSIPSSWANGGCNFFSVDISNNSNLQASIPPNLFTQTNMQYFNAKNTPLTGLLPDVTQTTMLLQLSKTNIQFCNSSSGAIDASTSLECDLSETLACGCPENYPAQCNSTCAPIPPYLMPTADQPPVSTGCTISTRPSAEFTCVNGVWTAPATNAPILTIPPRAGTVVVVGNLSSSTLIFHGTGSTIYINGSTVNLTIITLELDSNQVKNLGGQKVLQILVNTSGSSSNTDLSLVNVNTKVTSGCRKVKSEKATFDGGKTLGVYLSVDSSGCNTWWIILVSVVVAVIVIAAVVLVLLAVFYEPFRLKIRPYSGGRKAAAVVGK